VTRVLRQRHTVFPCHRRRRASAKGLRGHKIVVCIYKDQCFSSSASPIWCDTAIRSSLQIRSSTPCPLTRRCLMCYISCCGRSDTTRRVHQRTIYGSRAPESIYRLHKIERFHVRSGIPETQGILPGIPWHLRSRQARHLCASQRTNTDFEQ